MKKLTSDHTTPPKEVLIEPSDEKGPSEPVVDATPLTLEELKSIWKEQYEQSKRPGEPPWEEIEARFLERMKHYYTESERQAQAMLIDMHAEIQRCKRAQRVLSGEGQDAGTLLESPSGIFYEILSDVQAKPVPWLWPGYVPRGMLTILAGDPGEGKSYITLDIASRLSRGLEWPFGGGFAPVGTTLLVTLEDPSAYVIRPRLDLLKADSNRIIRLDSIDNKTPNLERDRERLQAFITEKGAALVVIDPLNSYLGSKFDTFKDNEVRDRLHPLVRMAEETGAALVCLMHLTKANDERSALHRLMGSVAFSGVARVVLAVGRAPQGDTPLFGGLKSNLGPLPRTLSYRIDEKGLQWGDEIDYDLGEVIEGKVREPDTRKEEACRFIEEVLPIGKRVQTTDLDRQARQRDFTGGTWVRAKQRMGVKSERLPDVHPPVYVSYRE